MKRGFLHEISLRILPYLVARLLRLWFYTCRVTVHGSEFKESALNHPNSTIAIFWHYSLVYVFYHLREYPAAVLVSASEDGEYIARLAHQLNFSTVRGSRNRHGLRALKELMVRLKGGVSVGLVADGSQGPPLVVQGGSILLASKTGAPIMPLTWSASRYYTFKSWDRTAIPKLFSHIDVYYAEPFFVPDNLDADGIERFRLKLEKILLDLYQTAWQHHGQKSH